METFLKEVGKQQQKHILKEKAEKSRFIKKFFAEYTLKGSERYMQSGKSIFLKNSLKSENRS